MAWGKRCDLGCESWPDEDIYDTCPQCGEPTERFSNLRPLDPEEARSMRLQFEFKVYYGDWCDGRGIGTSDPLEPTEEQHEKYDALYPDGRPDNA